MPPVLTGRARPLLDGRYRVTVPRSGGDSLSGWAQISGLGDATEVVRIDESTCPDHPTRWPGRTEAGDITFEKGVTEDLSLVEWREDVKAAARGNLDTSWAVDVLVEALDKLGRATRSWTLLEAWPRELRYSNLSGEGRSHLMVSMILVCREVREN